jgi:hypothetical protein
MLPTLPPRTHIHTPTHIHQPVRCTRAQAWLAKTLSPGQRVGVDATQLSLGGAKYVVRSCQRSLHSLHPHPHFTRTPIPIPTPAHSPKTLIMRVPACRSMEATLKAAGVELVPVDNLVDAVRPGVCVCGGFWFGCLCLCLCLHLCGCRCVCACMCGGGWACTAHPFTLPRMWRALILRV